MEFVEIADGLLINAAAITAIDGVDEPTVTVYLNNGEVHHLDESYTKLLMENFDTDASQEEDGDDLEIILHVISGFFGSEVQPPSTDTDEWKQFLKTLAADDDLEDNKK